MQWTAPTAVSGCSRNVKVAPYDRPCGGHWADSTNILASGLSSLDGRRRLSSTISDRARTLSSSPIHHMTFMFAPLHPATRGKTSNVAKA